MLTYVVLVKILIHSSHLIELFEIIQRAKLVSLLSKIIKVSILITNYYVLVNCYIDVVS